MMSKLLPIALLFMVTIRLEAEDFFIADTYDYVYSKDTNTLVNLPSNSPIKPLLLPPGTVIYTGSGTLFKKGLTINLDQACVTCGNLNTVFAGAQKEAFLSGKIIPLPSGQKIQLFTLMGKPYAKQLVAYDFKNRLSSITILVKKDADR